jgi:hypothetical protein
MKIIIDTVDWVLNRDVVKDTLDVELRIEERSISSVTLVDITGATTFSKGEPIEIYDDSDDLIFGGVMDSIKEDRVSPSGGKYHSLQCADWHYLADKRVAVESYATPQTCGYIVDDLFDKYLAAEGVIIGEIQAGPTLPTVTINYARVSDAIDALAEKANFTWYIDENKALYFVARGTTLAPWAVTAADMLQNPVMLRGNAKYRNRQYVLGGKAITDPQVETRTGDGATKSFAMGYPLAKEPTITVAGQPPQTVGIKGIDTVKDWYWSKSDENLIATVAPGAVAVVFTYQGEYEIVALVEDEGAIAAQLAIEGAGTGIVESVADEPTITDQQSAIDSGLAKLARYSPTGRVIEFVTRRSGLRPGQLATVTHTLYGLAATEMLIESVKFSRQANEFLYTVRAVEGPVMGGWARMFADMMPGAEGSSLSVGGNSLLVILKQFSEVYEIEGVLTEAVYVCAICGDGTTCGDGTVVC